MKKICKCFWFADDVTAKNETRELELGCKEI